MLSDLHPSNIRRKAGSALIEGFFRGLSSAAKLHPLSRLERHDVEAIYDVPYVDDGLPEHRLDIYRSTAYAQPRPVVLYVHGGGFRILSKETHWLMGLMFARQGYTVFNINYRLAPKHPFPCALEDSCAALEWVMNKGDRYGGDLDRVIFAGESAGANLITSMTVASCFERMEPYAGRVWELGVVPRVVLPACGILQVSDAERFSRIGNVPTFIADRLHEVSRAYLPDPDSLGAELDFADPLTVLESDKTPDRPLPPFFSAVGTSDLLTDDTRRLKAALDRREVTCTARYYVKEMHAFHALIWRKQAQQCWREQFAYLETHL